MGRALAHAHGTVPGFSDPYALQLLPEDCRAAVERRIRHQWPRGRREAMLGLVASATERMMGPRTVEIDQGLRDMPHGFQLVILGAGLDSRVYRMSELSESVAFEIDHPATQAFKRTRTAGLEPCTRELHHVAVDFSKERLGDALARAGHSTVVPTAWVLEGVISYLTRSEVESSIDAMAARSARGSRLLTTYNEPNPVRGLFAFATARAGEPHRTSYSPQQMRELLEQRGFAVRSDRDGLDRARHVGLEPTAIDRLWVRFHHVVIADACATGSTGVTSPRRSA
jgi:methyltransferase (TIGR00027 family)